MVLLVLMIVDLVLITNQDHVLDQNLVAKDLDLRPNLEASDLVLGLNPALGLKLLRKMKENVQAPLAQVEVGPLDLETHPEVKSKTILKFTKRKIVFRKNDIIGIIIKMTMTPLGVIVM